MEGRGGAGGAGAPVVAVRLLHDGDKHRFLPRLGMHIIAQHCMHNDPVLKVLPKP